MKPACSSSILVVDCPHRAGDKFPQEGMSPLLTSQDRATRGGFTMTKRLTRGWLIPAPEPSAGIPHGQQYGKALLGGQVCRDRRAGAADFLLPSTHLMEALRVKENVSSSHARQQVGTQKPGSAWAPRHTWCSPPPAFRCSLLNKGRRTSARCFHHPAAAAWNRKEMCRKLTQVQEPGLKRH